MDPTGLSTLTSATETLWYLYDAMNRVVIGQGDLVGGGIVRGRGVSLTWDAAGQRRSATTAANVTTAGYAPGTTPVGAHRESYGYSPDGQLVSVTQASAAGGVAFGSETRLASYTRDALGRVLTETNYDPDGVSVARSRYAIAYDNRGRVLSESSTQRQGSDTYTSYSTSWYNPDETLALPRQTKTIAAAGSQVSPIGQPVSEGDSHDTLW